MERKSLSAIDMRFLVKEFTQLEGGKIDGLIQDGKTFYIQIYHTKLGKKFIKIILPSFIFITDTKKEKDTKTSPFLASLKKNLLASRIKKIDQHQNERIIVFSLEKKHILFILIFELFSSGNIILCDEKLTIISCLTKRKFATRAVEPKQTYQFPKSINVFALTQKEFGKKIIQSEKENLVKALALDLSLGGLFAEEICLRSSLDKPIDFTSIIEIRKWYSLIYFEDGINKYFRSNRKKIGFH